MSELDDDRMRALLRSADVPRSLTHDERERLLARLAAHADQDDGDDDGMELVAATAVDGAFPRGRRTIVRWLGAAAAVIVLVGSVMVAVRDGADVPVADEGGPVTVPSTADVWCIERVTRLDAAIERWRGVENWAWAGGVPDVGSLAVEALEDPPRPDDRELERRAAPVVAELVDALATIDPAGSQREIAAAREDAVAPALALIDELASDPAIDCRRSRPAASP